MKMVLAFQIQLKQKHYRVLNFVTKDYNELFLSLGNVVI